MAHLITGYAGHEHIQSADQGSFNAAFFGGGQYVMESGKQLEASIIGNNTVRVLDGDLLMYGRHIRIDSDTYEDMTIDTGIAGQKRIDLICMTYEKNTTDGTERAFLEVIKGNGTEGTVNVPEYTDGNILNGAVKNQMPLYQVNIDGVVLSSITPLFATIPTYKALAERYAEQFEATITALKAADILDTIEEIDANTQSNMFAGALALKAHLLDESNPHKVSKEQIGLENVDNTPDNEKNVKTAEKLKNKVKMMVHLSGGNAGEFDGTGDVSIGVVGTVRVENGGTGVRTLLDLRNELIVFETTEVSATVAASSVSNVSLTAPTKEGFTFYPIRYSTPSTAKIMVQSFGDSAMRVLNLDTVERTPTYTIYWIGVKSEGENNG